MVHLRLTAGTAFFSACIHVGFLLLPAEAWSQDVYKRFATLAQSDPELYQLIRSLMVRAQRTVDGGFDWRVGNADLDCDEAYEGGFDSCEVEIDIDSRSHAEDPDDRNARLSFECSAELQTTDADGFISTEVENETLDVRLYPGRSSSDTVELDFSFHSYTPIQNVRITSASCDLTNIR